MANQVAYGFVRLQDVFASRVTEIGVGEVAAAIDQSLTEHNRQLNALIDNFCVRTTQFKTRYRTPSSLRLQPLDEHGRALPVTTAGHYDVAWPIQMAGIAHGRTFLAREKMTVEEVDAWDDGPAFDAIVAKLEAVGAEVHEDAYRLTKLP